MIFLIELNNYPGLICLVPKVNEVFLFFPYSHQVLIGWKYIEETPIAHSPS